MCVDNCADIDYDKLQTYRWQRARKDYECCACKTTIGRGALYHYTCVGSNDDKGHVLTVRHCARCWAIVEHLWTRTDAPIDIRLNCGNRYDAPPDDPGHALAFLTDAEAEAWALKQPRVSSDPGGSWVLD